MTWSSENHRQGVIACSPLAYSLVSSVYLLGVLTLAMIFFGLVLIAQKALNGDLTRHLGLYFLLPAVSAACAYGLNMWADILLRRKGFQYDYKSDKAYWNDQ